jgi:RNA-directed DNA polymerase
METGLERIAAKARKEANLRFTSLCHHITRKVVWKNLCKIPKDTAPGIDGIDVEETKESFGIWVDSMLGSVNRKGYKAPLIRRVYIPKPGKSAKRPLGIPNVADRALQRSVSEVLGAIYEQDFLPCSFGGRPGLGAHNALSTLNEIIAGRKVSWVLEADLKDFFGSLNHGWLLWFVEHRVGDPRILNLIRRWLKAGVMDDGHISYSETGTPQGGPISVLLSNIYLHYILDLWFAKIVKPRMKGEAYLIRYIDDFLVCFQYRSDAIRFQRALMMRLGKYSLELEPDKTRLVEFGRFSVRHARERRRKQETIYFLGFTHFCTLNHKGNYKVGRKTEKSRFRRSVSKICLRMKEIRHWSIGDQVKEINQVLRGHYAYYGIGGNFRSLAKIYNITERYWRKMLASRSRKGKVTWEKFQKIKELFPLQRPRLVIPYRELQSLAVL